MFELFSIQEMDTEVTNLLQTFIIFYFLCATQFKMNGSYFYEGNVLNKNYQKQYSPRLVTEWCTVTVN